MSSHDVWKPAHRHIQSLVFSWHQVTLPQIWGQPCLFFTSVCKYLNPRVSLSTLSAQLCAPLKAHYLNVGRQGCLLYYVILHQLKWSERADYCTFTVNCNGIDLKCITDYFLNENIFSIVTALLFWWITLLNYSYTVTQPKSSRQDIKNRSYSSANSLQWKSAAPASAVSCSISTLILWENVSNF